MNGVCFGTCGIAGLIHVGSNTDPFGEMPNGARKTRALPRVRIAVFMAQLAREGRGRYAVVRTDAFGGD